MYHVYSRDEAFSDTFPASLRQARKDYKALIDGGCSIVRLEAIDEDGGTLEVIEAHGGL